MYPEDFDCSRPHVEPWLCEFVRNELVPLFENHRAAALEGLRQWLAARGEQVRRLQEFRVERDQFVRERAGRHVVLPNELCREPDIDQPLPVPGRRTLSMAECWVALMAVHDVVRDARERIGPRGDDCVPYHLVCDEVLECRERGRRGLRVAHLPNLRRILARAAASVNGRDSAAGRNKGVCGRPAIGQGKAKPQFERLKKNVYEIIQSKKAPGVGPSKILDMLKKDNQFKEQVTEAGLVLGLKLVRAALRVLPAQPANHEIRSRNVS